MGTGDITSSSSSKKCRIIDGGEDCISNLPESVLSHILSRMPTKDAVKTSVLSKDWLYRWTSIYKVDLEDTSCTEARAGNFVRFVDRLLHFTCISQIQSFRLSFKMTYDTNRIITWISALLWRKVQTLEISYCGDEMESFVLPLPHRLLDSSFLTELKLNVYCTLRVAGYNYFPNLKCLKFMYPVEIVNEQSPKTGKLLLNFPVLEEFQIGRCQWTNVKSVKIDAPEMTIFQSGAGSNIKNDHLFEISANKLEKFEVYTSMDDIILTAPSVKHMNFCVSDGGQILGSRAFGVLKGFLGLKHLEITGYLIQILESLIRSKPGPLPFFNNLQHLHVRQPVTGTALRELLGVMPSLKSLTSEGTFHGYSYDCDCVLVESLPSCALSNLKEIRIRGFNGQKCQTHLAKFLLENAENLQKVFVHLHEYKPTVRMAAIKRIFSEIPKRSSCVSIEVIDVVKKKKRVR